jgi:uncharacterized tellurite resistance protein B-like protein
MPQQDLYIGLGSMAYALAKSDGRLQSEELEILKQLLIKETHGEIALYTLHLQDSHDTKAEEAYQFALRRFQENRRDLDESIKKKFIRILEEVANAYEGITRKESNLLRQCRKDLRKL